MKIIQRALIFIFIFLSSSQVYADCNQVTSRNVAKLYVLALPFQGPEPFINMVSSNREILTENSPTVVCARLLGNRLVNMGINAYDPDAYRRAMGVGPAEHAPDVADSIHSGAVDLYTMGNELIWLSQVLPPTANGNNSPFLTTGTQWRLWIKWVWPMYEQIIQLNPSMAPIINQSLSMMGPMTEEQVFMLGMMLGQ